MKFEKEKILLLHKYVVQESGGSMGVRDLDLLDSALKSIYQTFDDIELYPTKQEKAARLGYSLISNHAFIDGNKRIGMLAMLSFLALNGVRLQYTEDEIIEIGLGVAKGEMRYSDLLEWIKSHENYKDQGYEMC